MQPFEKMPFNEEVVKILEKLLAQAKEGRLNFIGYAVCEGPDCGYDGFAGERSVFYTGYYGLMRCARRIQDSMDATVGPERKVDAPANMYCYDVTCEPISHDFIAWLVQCKMMQAHEGVSGPTKICFIRHKNEAKLGNADDGYRAGFFKSVMEPALKLFDCVVDPEARNGRRIDHYTCKDIVDWCRDGVPVPKVQVPPALMADMKKNLNKIEPVTITLREHSLWTHRNSDLYAWRNFACWLEERGEHVIFVRDYAKADEDIFGFETFPAASKDALIRTALYESAKCNLFASNGPAVFALFGSKPWLQFIHCDETEKYSGNTPRWWRLYHGIEPGEQFPWCREDQRIIWAPDTYENMVRAWEETFQAGELNAA